MKGERRLRILHVDDEKNQLEFTKLFLEQIDKDLQIDSASSPEEALLLQETINYDCVVSDYKMLSMNGIELAEKVREKSKIPFILYTGHGSEEVAEKAFTAGVDDYLRKELEPTHYQVLAKRIRHTVEKHRTDELYMKVVEESRDAIIIMKQDRIVFSNKSTGKLFGLDPSETCVGESIYEYINAEPNSFNPPEKGLTHSFEATTRKANGTIVEVSMTPTTYKGEDAYLVFIRNITRRKRNAERLEAIHQQTLRLSATDTIQQVSEITLDIMKMVFETKKPMFHHITEESEIHPNPVVAKAAQYRKSALIPDTSLISDLAHGSSKGSMLVVPAVLDGETVAVLSVESTEVNDFSEEDRKLLETLAYHIGFTYNRIREIEEEKQREEAERIKLNYALGRLDHVEKVTSLVRGDLQGNILSILNASDILRNSPEMRMLLADSIDTSADAVHLVSEKIREAVAKLPIGGGLLEVNQCVRRVIEEVFTPRNVRVNTRYDDHLLIAEMDETILNRILRNLLNNAIEAMPNGGTLGVKVFTMDSQIIIEIMDTGTGVPEETLGRLFKPFNTSKPGHSGLGLAFCKNAIKAYGGETKLKETNELGSTFTLTLPLLKKI